MSKLDRQLEQVNGQERIVIRLAAGEELDVGGLHHLLRTEIDRRPHRVPLDLRKVEGAPQALIDVLISSQRYARQQGKLLTISYAMPEMRKALDPRGGRSDEPDHDQKVATGAGDAAKSLLESRHKEEDPTAYDVSGAETVDRSEKKKSRRKRSGRKYAVAAACIVLATVTIGAVEWFIIFNDDPSPIMPVKTFESAE